MSSFSPNLDERRVVVTGAARGLGRSMATALVRAGARVVFTATDTDALNEAVESSGFPSRARIVVADLMKDDDVQKIFDVATKEFGGIDVLINNAGIVVTSLRSDSLSNPIMFWEIDLSSYRRFFQINTLSALNLACMTAPQMIKRGWGRIINVTTSLGTMLKSGMAPYGSTKASLEALTAIMARDLEGTGVTANVLVPGGPADTRMIPADLPIARDALISPDAMVPPVLWLVSDDSNQVNGRRFIAAKWDPTCSPHKAAELSGAPVAWVGYGTPAIDPVNWSLKSSAPRE